MSDCKRLKETLLSLGEDNSRIISRIYEVIEPIEKQLFNRLQEEFVEYLNENMYHVRKTYFDSYTEFKISGTKGTKRLSLDYFGNYHEISFLNGNEFEAVKFSDCREEGFEIKIVVHVEFLNIKIKEYKNDLSKLQEYLEGEIVKVKQAIIHNSNLYNNVSDYDMWFELEGCNKRITNLKPIIEVLEKKCDI